LGTTAEKIARNTAAQMTSPGANLAGKQPLQEAEVDRDGFEQIADGLDPCHAVYVHAQGIVSIVAEHLSATKEARQFTRIVHAAEAA
jgi:hypothetical protein